VNLNIAAKDHDRYGEKLTKQFEAIIEIEAIVQYAEQRQHHGRGQKGPAGRL